MRPVFIDVLLPFHRKDRFLEEAISSVFASKDVNIRLILINDSGESADLSEIVKFIPIDSKIELIQTSGKCGYGYSLAKGRELIESEFVALMNSDDLISPYRIFQQASQLKKNRELSISLTRLQRFNSNGRLSKSLFAAYEPSQYSDLLLILGAYGANASWFFRSETFTDWDLDDDFCLDWRLAMKYFPGISVGYLDNPLYMYRRHPNQITNRSVNSSDLELIYNSWKTFAESKGITATSIENFVGIATPWISKRNIDFNDFSEIASQVFDLATNENDAIKDSIYRIIKRRFLFCAFRELNSPWNSARFLRAGLSDLPFLVRDSIWFVK